MNKSAKGGLWVLVIAGIAVYLIASGTINLGGLFGATPSNTNTLPADKTTTVTLNTGDRLATTTTNANVSYYVFDSSGKFLKDGTTATGTASFTVPAGASFKLIAYDDTSAVASLDYLPIETTFDSDGNGAQTVNLDLYRESNTTMSSVSDPLDLNANISLSAGGTSSFDAFFKTETSDAAVNKPVMVVVANGTCIDTVSMASGSVACPARLQASQGFNLYCFPMKDLLTSSEGLVRYSVNVKALSTMPATCTTTTASVSHLQVYAIDTGIYRDPDYKTKGYSAFHYGTENPLDRSNIGAGDSGSLYVGIAG